MKKILILMSMFAALSIGCSKDALETFPSTGVSSDTVYGDVENASAAMAGTLTGFGTWSWTQGYSSGVGFGITETYLTADALAEDYVLAESGSGWMWQTYAYNLKNWFDDERLQCNTDWNCYYTTINTCNELIAASELLSESPEGIFLLGEAYALRACSYHMLAQLFARSYYDHPDDLCVPVYLEPSNSTTEGAPRSTNREVYEEVIYPDIELGAQYLKQALDAGVKRKTKEEIDYYVANGIKTRIALAMHKWTDAYTAAEEALKGYVGNEVLAPSQITNGMNDITSEGSVMWGLVVTPDNYGMYASYFSQMDANHDGYANKARRCCTPWLWSQLGPNDARRAWWRGDFDNSQYEAAGWNIRYCQTKFTFQGTTWLGDYTYMRAEEMVLSAAEAYCHAGNDGQARNYLKMLMDKRDPDYNKADSKSGTALGTLTVGSDGATPTGSLLEEILIQRRIELWGEFGRLFDIKRLHQGFKRVAPEEDDNPNFSPATLLDNHDTENPDTYAWILLIPQMELDGNPNIVQNPTGDAPAAN